MLQKTQIKLWAAIALTMGLISCNSPQETNTQSESNQDKTTVTTSDNTASQNTNKPSVVATTSVICDLTQQVAVDTVDLKCLVGPGDDPHVYQPKPEDRKAIDSANLILYAGYDFDPSLIKLVQATSNPAPKVAVHEKAVPKPILGEPHDHSHGHGHNHKHEKGEKHSHSEKVPDPHVWHDAQNGIKMVEVIRDSLKQVAPNHADLYKTNAAKVTGEISQIHSWIKSQIATIPPNQRKLVTTHDALGYYIQAYGLSFSAALEGISTEEQATAARVGSLVKEIKKEGVPTIFAEKTINPRLMETVAKEANVKLSEQPLYTDGLGAKGSPGETYQKMLIANTQNIVQGLGGSYSPFRLKNLQ